MSETPGAAAQRFPRTLRLTSGRQFRDVLRAGEAVQDRYFRVIGRPNGVGHPRLGLAVSRRVARRAVTRNRLKRLVRERFRQTRRRLDAVDVVVIARAAAREAEAGELRASLDRLWERWTAPCAES